MEHLLSASVAYQNVKVANLQPKKHGATQYTIFKLTKGYWMQEKCQTFAAFSAFILNEVVKGV